MNMSLPARPESSSFVTALRTALKDSDTKTRRLRLSQRPPILQASGAYIFRPSSNHPQPVAESARVHHLCGPVLCELHQEFGNTAALTLRAYQGATNLEQEWTVGPIDVTDGLGKEVRLASTQCKCRVAGYSGYSDSHV